MNMTDWAAREVEIACKKERGNNSETDFDYGCACYESALKAYKSLMEDGHSGMSIDITKNILMRLLDDKPLTFIEDTPDIWNDCRFPDSRGKKTFQCSRMSSLFKDVYPDGKVSYHDNDRCCCVYLDNPKSSWHSGLVSRIIHEKYPITMPYYPESKPYVAYCTDGLFDPNNGDFDTIGIWYIIKPDGEKEIIERFFKAAPNGWDEISKQEYFERVGNRE